MSYNEKAGRLAEEADRKLLQQMRRIELETKDPAMRLRAQRYIRALEWWIFTGQSRGPAPPGEGRAADRILRAYESRGRG